MIDRSPVAAWLSGVGLAGLSNVLESHGFDDVEFLVSHQPIIVFIVNLYYYCTFSLIFGREQHKEGFVIHTGNM